jgi:hypothetical protein
MKKLKRISLDGWEITANAYWNEQKECTIHRVVSKDFVYEKKVSWVLTQEGYKKDSFNTPFEAIQKVNLRDQQKALEIQKRYQSENKGIIFP